MLCAEASLVKHGDNFNAAKVLYCRSWQCEICRPRRAKQLIAEAIKGQANRFLTLTVSDESGPDPVARCKALIKAWRTLREEIACNLALPPHLQWALPHMSNHAEAHRQVRRIRRDAALMRQHAIPFLCVIEAQKNGNPHLHIMARMPYVPQAWISARMAALINAPICDIRDVRSRRKLANYVAKYCGKDPQRFGTCKRYWQSPNWRLTPKIEKTPWRIGDPIISRSGVSIEGFEKAEHCWARKIFWEGAWLVSVTWNDPDYERQPCEHDHCQFPHHRVPV